MSPVRPQGPQAVNDNILYQKMLTMMSAEPLLVEKFFKYLEKLDKKGVQADASSDKSGEEDDDEDEDYQWSFKAERTDPNWDQRTDQKRDFHNYDDETNKLVEAIYQKCKNGTKEFGEEHRIKKGKDYVICGDSQATSSWVQKNLKTTFVRKLRRVPEIEGPAKKKKGGRGQKDSSDSN